MRRTTLFMAWAIALMLGGGTLWAHHSTTAEFDTTKRMSLTGTMTKVDWVNPHIFVYMDAKSAGGNAESWKLETNPPAWFRRVGVSRADLAKGIGQTVTVEANRAKDGSTYGYLLKLTFADGTSIELVSASVAAQGKAEGGK